MTTLYEPIWAALPNTSRLIDVAPILNTFSELDGKPGQPLSWRARDVIKRTIRVLATTVHDPRIMPPEKLADLYADLFELEDMFNAMQERPGAD